MTLRELAEQVDHLVQSGKHLDSTVVLEIFDGEENMYAAVDGVVYKHGLVVIGERDRPRD